MLDKKLKSVIFSDNAAQAQQLLAAANKATRVAALNAAAMYGKANVARVVLDLGVDANAADDGGEPPLVQAARGGYSDVVRLLLARGARVDALSPSKMSALAEAVRNADDSAVTRASLDGGDFEDLEAEPDAGVKPRWWNRKWLPFASNGQGDLLCLDFDPAKGGRKGQVVEFLHESPSRARLGDSIAAYLSSLDE